MDILALVLVTLALFALRQNILVILGVVTAYAYLAYGDGQVANIIIDAWDALNKEVLLSIPLYILAGNIMSRGSMAARLIRLMRAITAPVPGGLAIATILSCAIFAAISGSSTVTLLAVGSVMYPALIQSGYTKRFALGALCAAGTLGIVVPPSIPLILFGVMTQTSISDLFIAGIGPAMLLTCLMAGYAVIANRAHGSTRLELTEVGAALRHGIWALFMPVLILGGIYSGYFTATESAAVAVVYAFVVEVFIHREMGFASGLRNRWRDHQAAGFAIPGVDDGAQFERVFDLRTGAGNAGGMAFRADHRSHQLPYRYEFILAAGGLRHGHRLGHTDSGAHHGPVG